LIEILHAEWKGKKRMQHGKGINLNYFCINETNSRISEKRNGRKKQIITYYLETSPTTLPKSDEH